MLLNAQFTSPRTKKNSHRLPGRLVWSTSPLGRVMPTKIKSSPVAIPALVDARFLRACGEAVDLSREELLAVAVARGCRHYAPLWPDLTPVDRASLPHEVLSCALLHGPVDAATFQSIRCGAMVLGDLGNAPELIAAAAERFGVTGRVAHIARLGVTEDLHAEFWAQVLVALPAGLPEEQDFLPGVSRLVAETRLSGPGKGPARVWLRTQYRR